jgi:restriction endonuclease S subunit
MAIKKSELYSSLWSSCDELRGGMDASQYKDYVLAMLFIKYVSDKYVGVPQLTAPQISTYRLPVPSLAEQTAIATLLSDMDAEIAALESRLAKTREIKQGMMQELLTGRIRLV